MKVKILKGWRRLKVGEHIKCGDRFRVSVLGFVYIRKNLPKAKGKKR